MVEAHIGRQPQVLPVDAQSLPVAGRTRALHNRHKPEAQAKGPAAKTSGVPSLALQACVGLSTF
jgi:hypothetical protein